MYKEASSNSFMTRKWAWKPALKDFRQSSWIMVDAETVNL